MNTEKKAVTDSRNVAGVNWEPITSNKAFSICFRQGKKAPFAGYMTEVKGGFIRCVRDENGTRFESTNSTLEAIQSSQA